LLDFLDALFALGRWTEAVEVLDSADLDPPRVEAPFLDGRRAQIDVAQGRFRDGARLMRLHHQLVAQSRIPTILAPFVCAGAELAIWNGDADAAAAQTFDLLPAIEAAPDVWVGHLGPVYAVGLRAHADVAALARSRKLAVDVEIETRVPGVAVAVADVDAVEKVLNQAAKAKGRWQERRKRGEAARSVKRPRRAAAVELEVPAVAGDGDAPVRRIKRSARYAVKPMTADEAALELDGREDAFLVFRDARSNTVQVLYRRKDGHLGLIDPDA